MLMMCLAPRSGHAGAFCANAGCDTLSLNPLRVLDRLTFFDDCSCRTLCAVRVEPYSYQGSAIVPVLGGVGSATFTCSVDSTQGTATFTPPACITTHSWHFNEGTGVIVDSPDACFQVKLYRIEGYWQPEVICFHDAPTAAVPETWGTIKATYR